MESTISGETESTQPKFSSMLGLKEGELLFVWSKGDCIWLEAVSIHFESLVFILTEEFHCSIWIILMNGEGTNPPRLEFSLKDVKLGITEQHFISFLEIFSSHHLIMPFLRSCFGNFGVQISIIP